MGRQSEIKEIETFLNYEVFWCGSRKECMFEAVMLFVGNIL